MNGDDSTMDEFLRLQRERYGQVSNRNNGEMVNLESMTESEALDLFYKMERRFGWAGVLYTRRDVADVWDTLYGSGGDDDDPSISDEMWDAVRRQYGWRKMGDYLSAEGHDGLVDAINDARRFLMETRGQ